MPRVTHIQVAFAQDTRQRGSRIYAAIPNHRPLDPREIAKLADMAYPPRLRFGRSK